MQILISLVIKKPVDPQQVTTYEILVLKIKF